MISEKKLLNAYKKRFIHYVEKYYGGEEEGNYFLSFETGFSNSHTEKWLSLFMEKEEKLKGLHNFFRYLYINLSPFIIRDSNVYVEEDSCKNNSIFSCFKTSNDKNIKYEYAGKYLNALKGRKNYFYKEIQNYIPNEKDEKEMYDMKGYENELRKCYRIFKDILLNL